MASAALAVDRKRILVVEDEGELAEALSRSLGGQYEVQVAGDGPAALAAVAQFRPDLILLDVILPTGTGLQVLDELGRQGEHPAVLVMSGLADQLDLSAYADRVADVLTKPFGLEEVRCRVGAVLAGSRSAPAGRSRAAPLRVLLVDDDPGVRAGLAEYLESAGYAVSPAASPAEVERYLADRHHDVALVDWILPGATGLEVLAQVRAAAPHIPVIILSGYASPEFTRKAMAAGAADVLLKPFPPKALPLTLEKCLQQRDAARTAATPPATTAPADRRAAHRRGGARYGFADIWGHSRAIQRARQALRDVARLDSAVLIRGETGTGKELFAHALHELSRRSAGPFVVVNAAAIPEALLEAELFGYGAGAFTGARREGQAGKFAQADGGTLFLDEIGDLPLALQAKLLRVLQEGEVDPVGGGGPRRVDVRVVAATNRELQEMVRSGQFRGDLYYRLNVLALELPPLRERPEDVAELAQRYLEGLCQRYGMGARRFSSEALAILQAYPWPGNVRELRNAVEQALALSSGALLLPRNLPPHLQASRPGPAPGPGLQGSPDGGPATLDLESVERDAIRRALQVANGNKSRAARLLGISRANLYIKLKVYNLE